MLFLNRIKTAVYEWLNRRSIAALTVPCDESCGSAEPHDAHLNADWNGETWVPRTWPWSRLTVVIDRYLRP